MELPAVPERCSRNEIPTAKRWEFRAAYELEQKRIKDWLLRSAEDAASEVNATRESVLASGPTRSKELEAEFGTSALAVNAADIKKAESGVFQTEAGSLGLIRVFFAVKLFLVLLEFAIFLLQFLSGSISISGAFLQASILAVCGYALGRGVGEYSIGNEGGKGGLVSIGPLVVGFCGILAVAAIRAIYTWEGDWSSFRDTFTVIVVTTIVAFLIALFQALHQVGEWRYDRSWDRQHRIQIWLASEIHKNNYKRQLWDELYSERVEQLFQERNDVVRREVDTTNEEAPNYGE